MLEQHEGQAHKLWYTRREDEVKGPFPQGVIRDHILLGRIREGDELSLDAEHWQPLSELPELIPEVMLQADTPEGRERLIQARLHADERRSPERRDPKVAWIGGEHRRRDRREAEPEQVQRYRESLIEMREAVRSSQAPRTVALALIGAVAVVLIGAFLLYRPQFDASAPADCARPPAPGVNWSYCHLEGRSLVGADLSGATLNNAALIGSDMRRVQLVGSDVSYADLSVVRLERSNLVGANLTGTLLVRTDLTQANLEAADLSFANLEGARLAGARLDRARLHKTIWVDGRLCGPESIGECRP